jgi:hypothetical protein
MDMLLEETNVDWDTLKASVTYLETDNLAVIRRTQNTIEWAPLFLNAGTNEYFIRSEGSWLPFAEVKGFERYAENKIPVHRMFDTATLEYIPV